MKLEDQVSSLALSKRLKELGVKQESYFHWRPLRRGVGKTVSEALTVVGHELKNWKNGDADEISAFTVGELGEMLPRGFSSGRPFGKDLFECWPTFDSMTTEEEAAHQMKFQKIPLDQEKTEVDCRALMLIYLIENNLVTVEEINRRMTA